MAEAKAGVAAQLQAFVANTLEYMKREGELLIDGIAVPELRTRIEGRHVLVVVRGYHHREDLAALRSYIREFKPVMVGVDGGADALLEAGYRPDLIVGDMDSVSDQGLPCGAELVVHAYPDGRAPGLARVERLGLPSVLCPAGGTSEDVALLLADEKGASLIVAVGTHYTLDEFLDKGRSGFASTFLTRLRVGSKLVDAKGVSRLYRSRDLRLGAARPGAGGVLHHPRGHAGLVSPAGARSSSPTSAPSGTRASTGSPDCSRPGCLVIDFRYHLVSIVAVFLALAIGIVVGSTAAQARRAQRAAADRRPQEQSRSTRSSAERPAQAAAERG